jgi:hypothetical protein
MGNSNPFSEYTLHFNPGQSTGVDVGLDELANALKEGVKATVTLDKVTVDAGLTDIRLKELATVRVEASVKELVPVRLEAAVKELPLIRTDSKVDLGLDDIRITQLPPIQLELAVRPIRVHLPLNYSFCFELFGIRLFKLSICGEGMAVTEDYHPHASERCE